MVVKDSFGFNIFFPVYDTSSNSLSALNAQLWANEALMIIEEALTLPQQVNRNFEDKFAEPGDVINLYVPSDLQAYRKPEHSSISYQAVSSSSDTLRLNNNIYSAFELTQRQIKRSFGDLAGTYLNRAARAVVEKIDLAIAGEFYHSFAYTAGKLGTAVTYNTLADLATVLDNNNIARSNSRFLNVTPNIHGQLLKDGSLVEANKLGNGESRISSGLVGTGAGFDIYMSRSSRTIASGSDTTVGAVNNATGYAAGTTTLTVDGFTGTLINGSWLTIAGDMTPQLLVDNAKAVSDTTTIEIYPGLKAAVANDAVITVYKPVLINLSAGYLAGHEDVFVVDGVTTLPAVGQGITIGTTAIGTNLDPADIEIYSVIQRDTATNTLLLNKPLISAMANDATLFPMPPGEYNIAGTVDSVTFANRPLLIPDSGVVSAAIATDPDLGLSIRVIISYDRNYFKYQYSIDTLIGVKSVFPVCGALLLG